MKDSTSLLALPLANVLAAAIVAAAALFPTGSIAQTLTLSSPPHTTDYTPLFPDQLFPDQSVSNRASPDGDQIHTYDQLTDRSFLTSIAQNSIEAIALTAAAQQRCQRAELQELATKLGEDQQLSLRKIREIAEAYGIDLQPVADQHLTQINAELSAVADGELDSTYMEFMRTNQATATQLLQHAAAETRLSADMRILANNLMTVVWTHRHHIQIAINTFGAPRQELSLRM
jgi:predicted outer membrane protein